MNGERYKTDCFWCGALYFPKEEFCPVCGSTILTGPIEIVNFKEETEDGE